MEAQSALDGLLLSCFAVQKMYGRAPENLEAINQVFHRLLAEFPAHLVTKSFEIWIKQNQEFPTPADIIDIIEKRPPKLGFEEKNHLEQQNIIEKVRKEFVDGTWNPTGYPA